MRKLKRPLLSVCLRTYNNQKFVLDALEGIFKQKVDFDLEFIYSDDNSSDNSFELVQDAIRENLQFDNMHIIKQPHNLGWTKNLWYLLHKSKGDYIALCDGDDYWSDSEKLQKQVDFLEDNPEFEVCFTNVCTVNENNEVLKKKMLGDGRRVDYKMKHLPALAPVSSRVFRNRDFTNLSETVPGEEVYLLLFQSTFGSIKFLNIVTGAYRYRNESVYSSRQIAYRKDFVFKTHIECMELVTEDLYPKYQNLILKKLVELRYLDKDLYLKRLEDLKLYQKEHPNRFAAWELFKITLIILVMRLLDFLKMYRGESLILRITNKII